VAYLIEARIEMSVKNISWRVKAAGAWGYKPCHLHAPIVMKSGSLNLLEPSGPVQSCTWVAHLYLHFSMHDTKAGRPVVCKVFTISRVSVGGFIVSLHLEPSCSVTKQRLNSNTN